MNQRGGSEGEGVYLYYTRSAVASVAMPPPNLLAF